MKDISTQPLHALTVEHGTRPRVPALPEATDTHRRHGRRLAAIHRMHLNDIGRIGILLDRIEAGEALAADLARAVGEMELAQNYRNFGSLCGRECKVLTFHHDAEEHSIFPQLEAAGSPAIRAVVQRLREEHEVVHELLQRLERSAMTLMFETTEQRFVEARDIFKQLEKVVRSHFGYEETELEEALGLYAPHF